jgi:PAS domain S-box-containing protein
MTGLVVTGGTYFLGQFKELEQDHAREDIGRLNDALNAQFTSLLSKNGDWSNWDDVYQFTHDLNEDFIAVNQTPNSFVQLNVSAMFFFDETEKLVYSQMVDLESEEIVAVPPTLTRLLDPLLIKPDDDKTSRTAFLLDDRTPYHATSQQILTSEGTGPSRGTLIFLHEVTGEDIKALGDTLHMEAKLHFYEDEDLPETVALARSSASDNRAIVLDGDVIAGFLVSEDAGGKDSLIWEIRQPRSIYAQGTRVTRQISEAFVVIGIVYGIIVLVALYIIILRRITMAASTVTSITSTGNLALRLPEDGRDEIASLSRDTNSLLEKLQRTLASEEASRTTLAEERDRASAIIESVGEGLVVLDKKLHVVLLNKAGQDILGLTQAEVVGQPWYELVQVYVNESKITYKERSVVKVMTDGTPIQTKLEDNHYFSTAKRDKFPVVATTNPYYSNGINGVVVAFKNATQEKDIRDRVEKLVEERTEEVQETRARLVSSINSLEMGFLLANANLELVLVNEFATKIVHYQGEDAAVHGTKSDAVHLITIKSISQSLTGKANLVKEIQEVIANKKTAHLEGLSLGTRDVEIFVSPVLLKGKVIGVVILLVDVTAEKQLDRAKDDFLSIASHELRTPLTAIMGNASMIEQYFGAKIKDKDLMSLIEDMKTASTRLIDLVNDFLGVSRLEQGRMVFKAEVFSVKELVGGVIAEIKATAKPKVRIEVGRCADVDAFADPGKAKEVMTNLVGNALKYTQSGTVHIDWAKAGGTVKCRITDTGMGIAPKDQLRLFQKFQQAGSSSLTRDTTRSSGLGLYISKLLVENMGGTIALESSEVGKGSVFSFSLPLAHTNDLTKKA